VGVLLAAVVLLAVVVFGRRLDASIGRVHFELKPNGGKTLRDAIDRRFDRVEDRLDVLEAKSNNS
jgi:hypothetical protein